MIQNKPLLSACISVVSNSETPFLFVGENRRILFANKAFLKLTAYPDSFWTKKTLDDICSYFCLAPTGRKTTECLTATGNKLPLRVSIGETINLGETKIQSLAFEAAPDLSPARSKLFDGNTLINNTSQMIWSFGVDLKLCAVNNSFVAFLKKNTGVCFKPGDSLESHPLTRYFLKLWEEEIQSVFQGNRVKDLRYIPGRSNFDAGWVELLANPIFDEKQQVVAIACYLTNRTEEVRKEQELLESENNLALAQKLAKLGNWSKNLKTGEVIWSDQMFEIFDIKRPENRQTFALFLRKVHEEDRERVLRALKGYFYNLDEYRLVYRVKVGDDLKYIEQIYFHERDAEGEVVKVFGTAQDITDVVLAQKELELSNERYAHVVRASRQAVWDWDLVRNELYRSGNGFRKLFGYDEDFGNDKRNYYNLLHPDEIEGLKEEFRRVIKNRTVQHLDLRFRLLKKNGEYAHVSCRAGILRDKAGSAQRMIGVVQDITNEVGHVQEIKRLQANTKALINNTKESIWSVDNEMKLITANSYFLERIKGFTGKTLVEGDNVIQPFFGKLKELWRSLYSRALRGEQFVHDYQTHDEQGRLLTHYHVFFTPMQGKKGEITGASCYSKNITELSGITAKLKDSQELFNSLFELSPQPMALYDYETLKFELVNEAAVHLFGFPKPEFLDMRVSELVVMSPQVNELLSNRFSGYNDSLINNLGVFKHRRKNGEIIDVAVSNSILTIKGRKYILVVGVDVTSKIKMQKEIDKAILKAQENERYEIGSELHDNICQLLASSKMRLGLLEKDIQGSNTDLFLQSRQYLTSALDEIRNLSHRLAPSFFNGKSIEDAFEELFATFRIEENYQLYTYYDEQLQTLPLSQDLKLNLYRILQEQLFNISRHAKATTIELDLLVHKNLLKMRISDNGIGFEPEKVRKGIGLNNMKRRAEVHNGEISVVSVPGSGTEVTVHIPISKNFILREQKGSKWKGAY